ncbi:MAG: inositol monophosphatase family protein [Corynebacterium sp.]|uniref:inositol monophosphatase family protein n=1 Tax=Corynebacterium sp. TaxID=1720 RepID=UPI0026DFF1F4|nr:inositol monophosphatase family protein [Corynebacterium sp.]MDO5670876.1 inositol monophosphatase family protein [Corynebacterium sp.]
MASHDPHQLTDIAVTVARDAAARIREKRAELAAQAGGDIRSFATTKSSAVDPVTIVDTFAEDFIADRLLTLRPDDGIIGEEGSERGSTSGVSWIVDPIDGTVNFLYGLPEYAVSIAAAIDGEVVAGCVVNAPRDHVYSATLGAGSFVEREGERVQLRCNDVSDPALALVATGFSYSSAWRAQQAALLAGILPQVRDIRRMGAAALDFCRVAEGTVDAFYEHGLHCWDFAAGALIAREAGAIAHTPRLSTPGSSGQPVSVAAGQLSAAWENLAAETGIMAPLQGR